MSPPLTQMFIISLIVILSEKFDENKYIVKKLDVCVGFVIWKNLLG